MFGIVQNEFNPVAGPRLPDMQLRRALLRLIDVQGRNAFRMLRHRREETALAGADFEHVSQQGQAFGQDKFETGRRIVAEALEQRLARFYQTQVSSAFDF